MCTRENIIMELRNRGYEVILNTRVKNGVAYEGILVHDGRRVVPFLYPDRFIEKMSKSGKSMNQLIEEILDFCDTCKESEFNIENLANREFVLKHINIGLKKSGGGEWVRRSCPYFSGVQQYLYLCMEDSGYEGEYFLEVTASMLSLAQVKVTEAWETAQKHLSENAMIQSVREVMTNIIGETAAEVLKDELDIPAYVLSNREKQYGASAVMDGELLTAFAMEHNTSNLLLIPTSIHEVVVFLDGDEQNVELLTELLRQSNAEDNSPKERLSDVPFLWKLQN